MISINNSEPQRWKKDIEISIDQFNNWFMESAPVSFITSRKEAQEQVKRTFSLTKNLTQISTKVVLENPDILPTLRMATTPPLAVDRLAGLAYIKRTFIKSLENNKIPKGIEASNKNLISICEIINKLLDKDLLPWTNNGLKPSPEILRRAIYVVADRLTGSLSNPIIRSAQEKRQFSSIYTFLNDRGYKLCETGHLDDLIPGSFAFHINIPVNIHNLKPTNISIDVVIKPYNSSNKDFPLLIECKSAGDFTNTNKRRKEEATKITQLRETYGNGIPYILFLCGYFDAGYLGYEAAEGIDWIWEHRISDFEKLGV